MKEKNDFTTLQKTVLLILRFMIGWHLLYEGFSKLLIPNWTSYGFLREEHERYSLDRARSLASQGQAARLLGIGRAPVAGLEGKGTDG